MKKALVTLVVLTAVTVILAPAFVPVRASTPTQMSGSTPAFADVQMRFSNVPIIGDPITIALSVKPVIDIPRASVKVVLPAGFTIDSATPSPYSYTNDTVDWLAQQLMQNTVYQFSLEGRSTRAYTAWFDAFVSSDLNGGIYTTLGGHSILSQVTASGAITTETGTELNIPGGPEHDADYLYDEPLSLQLQWAAFPQPSSTASVTLIVTNTAAAPVSYFGAVDLPADWLVISGDLSWTDVLQPGQSGQYPLTMATTDTEGLWQYTAELSLNSDPGYFVAQYGTFLEDGTSWDEHQVWGRIGQDQGTMLYPPSPVFDESADADAVGLTLPLVRQGTSNADSFRLTPGSCLPGDTRVDGHVTVQTPGDAERTAASLGYHILVQKHTLMGVWFRYDGREVLDDTLDEGGNFSVCLPLDGHALVKYWVYSTDAAGGKATNPWSARAYSSIGHGGSGARRISSVSTKLWVESGVQTSQCSIDPSGGMICQLDLAINEDTAGTQGHPGEEQRTSEAANFRAAVMHAHVTRNFLVTAANGPQIGETREAGEIGAAPYRAAVWMAADRNHCGQGDTPPQGCAYGDYYVLTAAGGRSSWDDLVLIGNHEFGHNTQHWLNGGTVWGMRQEITEGWADGFLSALTSCRAAYNAGQCIEDITTLVGDTTGGNLYTAGAIYAFSDNAIEDGDDVDTEFDELWQLFDAPPAIARRCEMRDEWWQRHIEPLRTQGDNTMAHNNVTICAVATATPTPEPTATPTSTP